VVLLLIAMGSISLLFGYNTRHAALMLFGLTMVAAVTMHDFWHFADGHERADQFGMFVRDFAISGGLLLMVGLGRAVRDRQSRQGCRRRQEALTRFSEMECPASGPPGRRAPAIPAHPRAAAHR